MLRRETQFTLIYGKKVANSANNGTEATEEPTKLLSEFMPIAMFKWAITQCGLSVSNFVKDFNINLLNVDFLLSYVPLLFIPAKKFL